MARQITAGIIHPVTLFDTAGNPINSSGLGSHAYAGGHMSTPAANAAATVTLGATAGQSWTIAGIYWSYNATPTSGQLNFTIGGVTSFTEYITDRGPGFFPFTPPIQATAGTAVVVTLTAGGAAVTGSLNVHAWTE